MFLTYLIFYFAKGVKILTANYMTTYSYKRISYSYTDIESVCYQNSLFITSDIQTLVVNETYLTKMYSKIHTLQMGLLSIHNSIG